MAEKITKTQTIYEFLGASGIEKERKLLKIADAIGKSTSAIYNKLRNSKFEKAEKVVIYYWVNGVLGTEEEVYSFFKKTNVNIVETNKK